MIQRVYKGVFRPGNRWHLWFWAIALISAPITGVLSGEQAAGQALLFRLVGLVSKMAAGYFIAYYLLPKVLFRRRYLLFVALLPVMVFGLTTLARFLNIYVAEAIFYPDMENENLLDIIRQWEITLSFYLDRVFVYALWFTFIKLGVDHLRGQEQVARLSKEKANAELRLLKAQIHPHFLFNTLNNLYALTVEKSDEAPGVVERLSDMLDYLLYRCNVPRVPLAKEVELIENYAGLEALRYGERLDFTFSVSIDDPSAEIAPLLLISPVENAFKHGAGGNDEGPAISIELTLTEGVLRFNVWNNKPPARPRDERDYTGGIGLTNVRRQLELLYPGRHELTVTEGEGEYEVGLLVR